MSGGKCVQFSLQNVVEEKKEAEKKEKRAVSSENVVSCYITLPMQSV
jgi:hypothetical protein